VDLVVKVEHKMYLEMELLAVTAVTVTTVVAVEIKEEWVLQLEEVQVVLVKLEME